MRYRGWTKNLLVFGALFFVPGAVQQSGAILRSLIAFAGFCALASSTYLINDMKDIHRDRQHPLKKNRPMASGRLSPSIALFSALILVLLAFGISSWLDITAFQISKFEKYRHIAFGVSYTYFGYFILTLLYTFLLKRIPILDVIIIAIGFVLRAVAGAAALNVEISQWLLLCTFLLSVYLALAKRRGELLQMGDDSSKHRENLEDYSIDLINQLLSITAATNILSYSLYTFLADTTRGTSFMFTIPLVVFGVFRYHYLVMKKGEGANPEEVLLKDRHIQIDILIWLIVVILILKLS
jgi:4-hydroxybenzoate polyprenyltransferase